MVPDGRTRASGPIRTLPAQARKRARQFAGRDPFLSLPPCRLNQLIQHVVRDEQRYLDRVGDVVI